MSGPVLVALAEGVVIVGSRIDAQLRSPGDRLMWFIRWLFWHLALPWHLYRLLMLALMAAAVRTARGSYARHLARQADPPPLIPLADEDSLSWADGSTETAPPLASVAQRTVKVQVGGGYSPRMASDRWS